MNKNLSEIVFIIDKSGSMHGLEKDTIGGFNSMLEKQKAQKGEALVSTIFFDSVVNVIHDRIPVKDVAGITDKDYTAGGCTALLDAIGGAVHHIGNIHKYARPEDVPGQTLFIITTDGLENASRCYNLKKVREMIAKKKKDGWQFIFLGANIDAVKTAGAMGLDEDMAADYEASGAGTELNFRIMSDAVSSVRSGHRLDSSWKKDLKR